MKKQKMSAMRRKELIGMWVRIGIGVLFITPVLLALLLSFVPDAMLATGLPSLKAMFANFTTGNYEWLLENIPVVTYVKNSLTVCVIAIVTQAITGTLAAYAFAFYEFKGKKFLYSLLLFAMMIPGEVCILCNYITVKNWGLLGTMIGLTITSWCACNTVIMLRQSYLGMPREMREAAMMDGCGEMRYMLRFAVPLSIPTLASLSITSFIGNFNAYLWPLLVGRVPEMYTIQIGMGVLFESQNPTYGRFMAGAIACMIAPVIVFVIFQRRIVGGMSEGAVKG